MSARRSPAYASAATFPTRSRRSRTARWTRQWRSRSDAVHEADCYSRLMPADRAGALPARHPAEPTAQPVRRLLDGRDDGRFLELETYGDGAEIEGGDHLPVAIAYWSGDAGRAEDEFL